MAERPDLFAPNHPGPHEAGKKVIFQQNPPPKKKHIPAGLKSHLLIT